MIPARKLAFAIRQGEQIARRIVCEGIRGDARIDLVRLAAERVVSVIHHVRAELIRVTGDARDIECVNEFFLPGVGLPAPGVFPQGRSPAERRAENFQIAAGVPGDWSEAAFCSWS